MLYHRVDRVEPVQPRFLAAVAKCSRTCQRRLPHRGKWVGQVSLLGVQVRQKAKVTLSLGRVELPAHQPTDTPQSPR